MANFEEETWRLTEDLTVEILIRLPVKSLLRFRYICKSWFDLIKSPYFIQIHLKYSSNRNNRILAIGHNTIYEDPEFFLALHSYESLKLITKLDMEMEIPQLDFCRIRFCGTCNGLLCISDFNDYALLWNPAIREYKIISLPRFGIYNFYCAIGFGFDSITNDYKLVVFARVQVDGGNESPESSQHDELESSEIDESDESFENNEYDEGIRVGIYNLSTNSWRKNHHNCKLSCIDDDPVCVPLVSGALHWIATSEGKEDDIERELILSFNMSTEVVGYIELPDDPLIKFSTSENFVSLTVLNESLALFVYRRDNYATEFINLWVMHEYNVAKSWTKKFSTRTMRGIVRPLLLLMNESLLLESYCGRLVLYGDKIPKVITYKIHYFAVIFGVMFYHESLVSVA